jgi:predicted kinase
MGQPTLIVVSGPAGSGKTTLAHALAAAVGCPAICRDEIKEGMVHATGEFTAAPGDELTRRTFPTFFGVLDLLLRAGVSTVAEAAFQDKLWRPRLEPLRTLARIRIVHCVVDGTVAKERMRRRLAANPLRRAHADHAPLPDPFVRVRMDVPAIEVDTTDGYRPGLDEVVRFVNAPG